MARVESLFKDFVQRMLETGETLCRIVIFVVNVNITVINRIPDVFRQQTLIHIRLGGLGSELHHHSCRCVGVHIRVLASNVVCLRVNYLLKNLAGLSLAGKVALITIGYILLGHLLAGTLHQFQLYTVLNLLDAHIFLFLLGNGICNLCRKNDIFSGVSYVHRFENSGYNLLIIEIDGPSVPFDNVFDHIIAVDIRV